MLLSDDWRQRYAAVNALSVLGKGCANKMTAMLEELLDTMILPFCQDRVSVDFVKKLIVQPVTIVSSGKVCCMHCYWTAIN